MNRDTRGPPPDGSLLRQATTVGRRVAGLRRGSLAHRPQVRVGAVVALAVAAGLVAWLLLRGSGNSTEAKQAPARAVSAQELAALPSTVHHPVYWAGPKPGVTYELTRTSAGLIYIRYLPAGVDVGAKRQHLTIGTYPVEDALGAVRAIAKRLRAKPLSLSGGGVAVQDTEHPRSVYFAYPGSRYEVEVFDPSPARARTLVVSGQVAPIGSGSGPTISTKAPAALATAGDLRRLAASVGHPVYWAGPRPGTSYERSRTSDGRIYVRYLPQGVEAGSRRAYLTVGTYPLPNAVAAVKAISKRTGARTFQVARGGIAVADPAHPMSVYLAFPGSNYEIEVFDPSAVRARQIVAAGRIEPVR
jgi:hypothetical protein